MIVYFVEALLIAVLLIVLVTQVVLPAVRGRALFPAFSRREKLKEDLASVRSALDEQALEKEIQREKQKLK